MATETSLVFGSEKDWVSQDITFGASTQAIAASSGGLYWDHPTGALSLRTQVLAGMAAASLANPAFELLQNGKLKLSWTGANANLTFDDSHLRDILGFTGNKTGANTYTSDNKPLWVWSPGSPLQFLDTPFGTTGKKLYDASQLVAPGGVTKTVLSATVTVAGRLAANYVRKARYKTTDDGLPGEAESFFNTCLVGGHHFLVVGDPEQGLVSEDDASTSAMTYTIANAIGPLVLDIAETGGRDGVSLPFKRSDPRFDFYYDIELAYYGVDTDYAA